MDAVNATTTMKAFVIRLEATPGLEEAVDVADSYSSIMDKNPALAKYILKRGQTEPRQKYCKQQQERCGDL